MGVMGRLAPQAAAIVAASLILCAQANAGIDLDALLIAMPFDEGGGEEAMDVSGNKNHGKLLADRGGDPFDEWGQGKFGSAVRIDGAAHVSIANNPTVDLHNSDFSLAMWFVFTDPPTWAFFIHHDNARGAESTGWYWYYAGERFVFHVITAGAKTEWKRSDFFETPELDRWYQIAIVRTGVDYVYYLDGEPFGRVTSKEPVPDQEAIGSDLTIGALVEPFWEAGFIDEVVVARQAWTLVDVRRHYNEGIRGVLAVRPQGKLATSWAGIKTDVRR